MATTNVETGTLIQQAANQQVKIHKGLGIASIVSGAIFAIIALMVPGKPGELGVRIGLGVFGVALVVAGALYVKVMTKRVESLVDMLLNRPGELSHPTVVEIRASGVVVAHSIDVTDRSGTKHRMRVQSEAAARQILARLQS